jgi:hypothetical protein
MSAPPEFAGSKKSVFLRPLTEEADAVSAFLLHVSAFPVPEPEIATVGRFVQGFMDTVVSEWKLSLELFIQYTQLHRGDGATRLSRHARQWMPKMGLGIWPDREPPRYFKREDFEELMPGDSLKPPLYKVFRVTATDARENACATMLGLGTVLALAIPGDGATLLSRTQVVLTAAIAPGSIRSFRFYVPLLEGKSFQSTQRAQIEEWLCGSCVYIRESVEDQAILIAASQSILPILKGMGASYSPGPDPGWRIAL